MAERGDHVGFGGRDLFRQVGAEHLRRGADPAEHRGLARDRRAGEDAHPHRAALAQVAGQRPGVDAADAHDALGRQVVVQAPPGPPVGRDARRVAHDVPGDPDPARLGVLVVHPGVADVRRGHHARPGDGRRVGQDLLVAGHARREDRLAEGLPHGPEGAAPERAAVLQDEHGRRHRTHAWWRTAAGVSGAHSRRNRSAVLTTARSTSPLESPRNRKRAPTCSYPPTLGITSPTGGDHVRVRSLAGCGRFRQVPADDPAGGGHRRRHQQPSAGPPLGGHRQVRPPPELDVHGGAHQVDAVDLRHRNRISAPPTR